MRALSTEALTQAIHAPGDDAFTIDRARTSLRLYRAFDLDDGPTQTKTLEAFAKAVHTIPRWAVSSAFDYWERESRITPKPADIVREARRILKRYADELYHRESQRRMALEAAQSEPAKRTDAEREEAERILLSAGFTPKRLDQVRKFPTARSREELAEATVCPPAPHWTALADPDGPEMAALRESREKNDLITGARAVQQARKDMA